MYYSPASLHFTFERNEILNSRFALEHRYYQVDPGGAESVHIGVTTVSGDVTVFVREISADDELVDGVVPVPELLSTCDTSGALVPVNCVKASTYDYHSLGGSTNEIDIPVSSDSTYFTIGVYVVFEREAREF